MTWAPTDEVPAFSDAKSSGADRLGGGSGGSVPLDGHDRLLMLLLKPAYVMGEMAGKVELVYG